MRVKGICHCRDVHGCNGCDLRGYLWEFEIDQGVVCQECGESFLEGSEEAEFIGWHGVCAKCELKGGDE